MPQTWLTSDTHLGHGFVAALRGFASPEEHDMAVAHNWDRRVHDRDVVWVLGDVALGGWRDRLPWFAERPGTKHLVLGNHDRAHPMLRNAHAHQKTYLSVFDSVQTAASLRHDGRTVLLSHFPYDGEGNSRDEDADRASQWRLRDEGRLLLHGHVHDDVRARVSVRGTLMGHVGLDAWELSPVTLPDIFAAIDERAPAQ